MHEVILPKLGLSMEKGTITQWCKQEGDPIEKGDVLFEIEADKANLEVEAYHKGILLKIVRDAGEELPVNTVIAYIGQPGEMIPDTITLEPDHPSPSKKESQAITKEISPALTSRGLNELRVRITPIARKICQEHEIDYTRESIPATGHEGKIRKQDILSYLKDRFRHNTGTSHGLRILSSTPLKGVRRVIADRMVESKTTIPHFVLAAEADVTDIWQLRSQMNSDSHLHITVTDLLVKITMIALQEHRALNAALVDDQHVIYEDIGVGLAVSTKAGLVVPVIRSQGNDTIKVLSQQRSILVQKAKEGTLSLEEMSGGTFSLSNLGMYNISSFSAIVNPPQAAILAVGKISESVRSILGEVHIRKTMNLSLSVDHRIVDGAVAAMFMDRVTYLLEHPAIACAL